MLFLLYLHDFYEQKFPLNIFIKDIEDFIHNKQRYSDSPDLKDIIKENNVELTNIGCAVYRGYTYLSALNKENSRKFCNYLNLWLDEQKNTHLTVKRDINEDKWVLIENLCNKLNEKEGGNRPCERHRKEKNATEITKRKNLMVYCAKRDFFKGLCVESQRKTTIINDKCLLFYKLTNENYTKFYNEIRCFDHSLDHNDYRYYISEDCDLNNMAKTFPTFNVETYEIEYNDKSRIQIEKCPSTSVVTGVDHASANSRHLILDSDENEITRVVHHTPPVQPSFDNKASKPIYYAGLSALGIAFTSMVLYKV
ncbi:CYIR protein [Plasmodium cynomolgi strain B]|uniref:CYIR protein n=1 Tax=Plasmodium cynomolgi (strain B) TaxID=1120755 RepID=K6UF34_PLACD|nr:CYIR protein [Plasmodium cynomolgi strain B]GAB69406.1 CYIR protein [Plasmodium cynomolgi strain B]